MGMSTGGSKGGAQSEINVTPLVDICLVLLIIFMVMLPKNVPNLGACSRPEASSGRSRSRSAKTWSSASPRTAPSRSTARRSIAPTSGDALEAQLGAPTRKVIFVNFDDDANYGVAVEVLDLAKRSGAEVLGIMKNKDKPTPNSLRPGAA